MNGLMVRFDRAGAGKHVSRWKKRMDQAIRRAVKASRRTIHMTNNSGSPHKTERLALKAKREVMRRACSAAQEVTLSVRFRPELILWQ